MREIRFGVGGQARVTEISESPSGGSEGQIGNCPQQARFKVKKTLVDKFQARSERLFRTVGAEVGSEEGRLLGRHVKFVYHGGLRADDRSQLEFERKQRAKPPNKPWLTKHFYTYFLTLTPTKIDLNQYNDVAIKDTINRSDASSSD